MDWIIVAVGSFLFGFGWCFWQVALPLKKKIKELQKRIVSNGRKV